MSKTITDTAALAAIGAATRELQLPQIRADAGVLAETAQRQQSSYLAFLAEVLSVDVDHRLERRKQRRVIEAKFPRMTRLGEFDLAAAPSVNPATIATLASGSYLDAGEPVVSARRQRHRQVPSADQSRCRRLRARTSGPVRHHRPTRQRARRSRRRSQALSDCSENGCWWWGVLVCLGWLESIESGGD